MASLKFNDFLLYSTGTELAYKVGEKYYNGEHFVWRTESFDAPFQPGSSNPRTLCTRYLDQILKKDSHAVEIEKNKVGILKGANEKLKLGVISNDQFNEISYRVSFSELEDFYPVIFLIKKSFVKKRVIVVDPLDRASKASIEYKIVDLKSDEFDIIHIKSILSGVVDNLFD